MRPAGRTSHGPKLQRVHSPAALTQRRVAVDVLAARDLVLGKVLDAAFGNRAAGDVAFLLGR